MIIAEIRGIPVTLGAVPAILLSAIATMVKYEFTQSQIRNQLAENYEEMKALSEAQITELAVALGRQTGIPEWEWFNTLRSARDMALFSDGNGTPAAEEEKTQETNIMPWVVAGVVLAVLLATITR